MSEIYDKMLSQIKEDLDHINESFYLFSKHEPDFAFSQQYAEGKIDLEELKIMGYHCFVIRFGFTCNAVANLLARTPEEHFVLTEFSVGILLRSCLLDSLNIFAWARDESLISSLTSDPFYLIPKELILFQDSREQLKNVGDFLNVNSSKKRTHTKDILEILQKDTTFLKVYELYSWYSKYDHFSPIPFMVNTNFESRLENIMSSLIYIKVALCQLHYSYGAHSSHQNEYILSLRIPRSSQEDTHTP